MSQNADSEDLTSAFGVPVFFGLWAGFGWWAIWRDPFIWTDWGLDPGPVLMPLLVLSLLSIGSALMLARAALLTAKGEGTFSGAIFRHLLVPAAYAASVLLMVPVMYRIGFLATAGLFSVGWMGVLAHARPGTTRLRRGVEIGAATIIGVGLVTYVFARIIHVPLP